MDTPTREITQPQKYFPPFPRSDGCPPKANNVLHFFPLRVTLFQFYVKVFNPYNAE